MCTLRAPTSAGVPVGTKRSLALVGLRRRSAGKGAPTEPTKRPGQSEASRAAEWRSVDRLKAQAERPVRQRLRDLFDRQGEAVAQNLRTLAQEQPGALGLAMRARKSPLIVEKIFDLLRWQEETADAIEPALRQAIEEGIQSGALRVGFEATDLTTDDPQVLAELQRLLRQTKNVQETLSDRLAEDIQGAISEGGDLEDVVQAVRTRFDNMKGWKSRQIAQTATTGAFESGQLQSFREAGIEAKEWLSMRDDRVRVDHRDADATIVALEDPFEVGGASLMYPGDPSAPPGQVVNCRCTLQPARKDQIGRTPDPV